MARIAIIGAAALLLLTACSQTQERPSGTSASTASQSAAPARQTRASDSRGRAVDAPRYPRVIDSEAGLVVVHMPQVDGWEDYDTLTAWAAVEAQLAGEEQRWLGSVKIEAQSDIDFSERVVVLHDMEIVDYRISGAETAPAGIRALVLGALPRQPRSVPLDTILRALPEDFEPPNYRPGPATQLRFEPPVILTATRPAALLLIDGEPVTAPIEGVALEFVLNTNWDLFRDPADERWYLRNGAAWQTTASLEEPDWTLTDALPAAFAALPEDDNWVEVRKALPPVRPASPPPEVLVRFEPAELIVLDGEPRLEPIGSSGLHWVTNTEANLFAFDERFYYLAAGRWFDAASLAGPWSASEALPEAFAEIPGNHPRAAVLAAVPGTDDARAAVLEARIPRTATISLDAVPDVEVGYAGPPQFEPIEGTSLERAVNTSYQVIRTGERFYLCYNGVWFDAESPIGAWAVATEVPAEIYQIPASDPYHNTTYVYTMPESRTQTSVTYAYGVGYYGSYVGVGVSEQVTDSLSVGLYFGTGFYYPPYYGSYPWGYPYYWYYPRSYGFGNWYNPATGSFGRAAAVYGPYGGARAVSAYNPRTGSYARGWSAWNNDEFYRQGGGYNPRTGTIAAGNMYYDFDEKRGWSERYVQRDDRWLHAQTEYDGNRARTDYETSRGVTGTSNRVREDGVVTGSGTIAAGDRTGTTESRIDREGMDARITGEAGRTVDISKDWGEQGRDVALSNADGQSISGSSQRGPGNSRTTDFETSGGASGKSISTDRGRTTVGRDAQGDLYAARNGDVYRRGDDGGWASYNNGSWNSVDRRANAANRDFSNLDRQQRARASGSRNHSTYQRQRSVNRGGLSRGGLRRR